MRVLLAALLFLAALPAAARDREPIIDMHLHALAANAQGPPPLAMCTPVAQMPVWDPSGPYGDIFMKRLKRPPCPDPIWSPTTDEGLMRESLAVLDKLNIIAVASGSPERVAAWRKAAPDRIIPGLLFQLEPGMTPAAVRSLHSAGNLAVFGEVTTQYAGIAPDDPRLEPYWALAEELDIPVGIHVGTGPTGVVYLGASGYRARLHSALTMEEVLVRHPKLRVYLSHAGYPMIDDLLALLYAHPQVHVDVALIVFTQPRAAFYRYLERIVEAGFGDRIMFGSDQMVWPGVIERSVRAIEEAPFLSPKQKRDILYNNAARFLRLTPEQMAAHRKLGK